MSKIAKSPCKVAVEYPQEFIEELKTHVGLLNKLMLNNRHYSTQAQWVREAIEKKFEFEKKKINERLYGRELDNKWSESNI